MTILDEIIAHKRQEVKIKQQQTPLQFWQNEVKPCNNAFAFEQALRQKIKSPHLICELKPASPSSGIMQAQPDIPKIIEAYQSVASALSILVDEKYFGGSIAIFKKVRQLTKLPLLFKEFVIDEYQIYEARNAGADAVLLIVKCLTEDELLQYYNLCLELGMTPVVEVQNELEALRAKHLHQKVVLINNRNLSDFTIDFATTKTLTPLFSKETILISASGIHSSANIVDLSAYTNCFLIGSSLMKTNDAQLEEKLTQLKQTKLKGD